MQEARRCRMRTLFYLSESQLERIKPFFPRSHGAPRVDDRRVVSGIIYVIKHSGRMHLMSTVLIKLCITVLCAGVAWAYSITFL